MVWIIYGSQLKLQRVIRRRYDWNELESFSPPIRIARSSMAKNDVANERGIGWNAYYELAAPAVKVSALRRSLQGIDGIGQGSVELGELQKKAWVGGEGERAIARRAEVARSDALDDAFPMGTKSLCASLRKRTGVRRYHVTLRYRSAPRRLSRSGPIQVVL
jgi:hypothetical protein